MLYKSLLVLIYGLSIPAFLFGAPTEAYDEDIARLKTNTVVGDISIPTDKALISVAFKREIDGQGFLTNNYGVHAYFHIKFWRNGAIHILGLHMVGRDYLDSVMHGEPNPRLLYSGDVRVHDEGMHSYAKKFMRAKKIGDSTSGTVILTECDPTYLNFMSFMVSNEKANIFTSDYIRNLKSSINFSTIGNWHPLGIFSWKYHNCCSFVSFLLKKAGISIENSITPKGLRLELEKYSRNEDKQRRDMVSVIISPT